MKDLKPSDASTRRYTYEIPLELVLRINTLTTISRIGKSELVTFAVELFMGIIKTMAAQLGRSEADVVRSIMSSEGDNPYSAVLEDPQVREFLTSIMEDVNIQFNENQIKEQITNENNAEEGSQ